MQYRTRTCDWGNQTCKYGTGYGIESVSYCSGPNVEICPIPNQSFGYFQELNLNGTRRYIRSSPRSCIRDNTMIKGHFFSDDSHQNFLPENQCLMLQG